MAISSPFYLLDPPREDPPLEELEDFDEEELLDELDERAEELLGVLAGLVEDPEFLTRIEDGLWVELPLGLGLEKLPLGFVFVAGLVDELLPRGLLIGLVVELFSRGRVVAGRELGLKVGRELGFVAGREWGLLFVAGRVAGRVF